jgi:hypothetical protein
MGLICSECDNDLESLPIGVRPGKLKEGKLEEREGYFVCRRHFDSARQFYKALTQLTDGNVFSFNEMGGELDFDESYGNSPSLEKLWAWGYLTGNYMKQLFPNTFDRHNKRVCQEEMYGGEE